jgi:hypothetical protein
VIENAVALIDDWAEKLGSKIKPPEIETLPHETVIRIRPSNSKASPVEFRFGKDGTFDFGVGTCLFFEDIDYSAELILEICKAVQDGKVKEKTISKNGKVLKCQGEIALDSGPFFDKRDFTLFPTLGKTEGNEIQFEPY